MKTKNVIEALNALLMKSQHASSDSVTIIVFDFAECRYRTDSKPQLIRKVNNEPWIQNKSAWVLTIHDKKTAQPDGSNLH